MNEILDRLDRIEKMLQQLTLGSTPKPQYGSGAAHLISLAKVDPQAAIAEAKRLSREDTRRRREAKKKKPQGT